MERREFLGKAGKIALGAAAVSAIAACGNDAETAVDEVAADSSFPEINWEMATSWPLSLDTIFGGAEEFSSMVSRMTGGKFTITPRAAGELVGAVEVLPSVETGAVKAGHTASYYYVGKSNAVAFGTALPFGLTARQQNAWLYEGGGQQLMQDFYRERFGIIQFFAGNTGTQMGGWFNKELNSVADLPGLKMRIPGLGGQVMTRLGVTVELIAGGEVFQALDTGRVDAAEWVGPYDDTKMSFQDAAKFYYYPGWWEPGPSLEVEFPVSEFDPLPEEYKAIIEAAAYAANHIMLARYDALNPPALADIIAAGKTTILPFPEDVMIASEQAAFALYDEYSAADPDFKTIFDSWAPFRTAIQDWHGLAEKAMLDFGALDR